MFMDMMSEDDVMSMNKKYLLLPVNGINSSQSLAAVSPN